MADDIHDLDALLAAHTRYVWDNDGNDWITVATIRTLDLAYQGGGNFALRVFLTNTLGQEGYGYAETMQANPLLYESVIFYGTIENIQGAGGRELYSGNSSANTIIGDGLDQMGDTDLIYGLGGNDILIGAGGSDTINGDDGNDSLYGDTDPGAQAFGNVAMGDDTMNGGSGDDLLIGGAGINHLDGGSGLDRVSYQDFQDDGYVSYYADVDLANGHSRLMAVGLVDGSQYVWGFDYVSNIEAFSGTMMADVMRGSTSFVLTDQTRPLFDGGAGNDSLTGGLGADHPIGGQGDDRLDSGGNGNIDYIADLLQGGTGNDTYLLRTAADIVEAWGDGNDTVQSDLSWTLGYNLENLVLSEAAGAGAATGNVLGNRIEGNNAANVLDGRGGNDTLVGGAGNDVYIQETDYDVVIELDGQGIDTVRSQFAVNFLTMYAGVENLVLTGSGDIAGQGNDLHNRITGNAGNNTLYNWGSGDTLAGGLGNDSYGVREPGTTVIEAGGAGIDTVIATIDYTLGANLEDLTVMWVDGLHGTGNALNNRISGDVHGQWLAGAAGNDTLAGGQGNDTLFGGTEDDVIQIDPGTDLLNGGTGNDTARYTGTTGISVDLAVTAEQATGLGNDRFALIENLQTGSGHDRLRGNAADNRIASGSGDDDLFGAAGNDILTGAAGQDTLRADSGNDVLNGGSEADLLLSAGSTAVTVNLSLATAQNTGWGLDRLIGIENVTSASGADRLVGNALANDLNGMAGNDTLHAGAGADLIRGGSGADSLTGGSGSDLFLFGTADGNDVISDFQDNVDAIVMGPFSGITVQDAGADTLLIFGTTRVTLQDFDHTLISAADFLLP